MQKLIQLYKSGHGSHDIIIDLIAKELTKRKLSYIITHEKNFRTDSGIYFTYIVISEPKSKRKRNHPLIYGIHTLTLMKNVISPAYKKYFDCIFVPSQKFKEYYIKKLGKKVSIEVINGAAKLDLFHNKKINKKKICVKYKLNPKLPVVLYVPTYGLSPETVFNGSEYLADKIIKEVLKSKVNILYLGHPGITKKTLVGVRKKSINVVDKSDLYAICDIFISDTSGTISEFLVFDKPIIRIKKDSRFYNSKDFNFFRGNKLVDLGDIIDVKDIHETLENNLHNDIYRGRRKYWLDTYIGKVDGHCAKREVDKMLEFAKKWWKKRQ